MPTQRNRPLVTGVLLAAIVLWVGCSQSKTTEESNKPATHAETAGPAAIAANADEPAETVVTPHMECDIVPGKNILWCATFQIAWNELCDLLGGPIQWNGAPEMVSILNKKTVTRRDLDQASYVAAAGRITGDTNDIRQKIVREIDCKFHGAASPDLLHLLDSVPPGMWASYAYLFKELPFDWAFERMRYPILIFGKREVESFGIYQFLRHQENEVRAASQVLIHDHRNRDDFIVELKTQSKSDRLILAKIPPGRTFAETMMLVRNRLTQSTPRPMQEYIHLLIPVIDFDVLHSYGELQCGPLAIATQQTRFKLDERGAVLKSEAGIAGAAMDANLIFDKPFLVMIQRTDASQPYFALWIANTELLVPFQPREQV